MTMKRRFAPILALLLLCLPALPSEGSCHPRRERTPREQRTTQKQRPARQGKQALMTLEEHVHDFGRIPRKGGTLHYEFRFTNTGEAPLVVVAVQTSCSCLKGTFDKRPVLPGASGSIRITYEPLKSEPGSFNKVVKVLSNSADGTELLTVQGCAVE